MSEVTNVRPEQQLNGYPVKFSPLDFLNRYTTNNNMILCHQAEFPPINWYQYNT